MENEEEVITEEVITEEAVEETVEEKVDDDYREKLNIQNRFLKKEGYEFTDGKWVKPEVVKPEEKPQSELSQKDFYALMKAGVAEEDIDEVSDYAKLKKISITDALKSNIVKTLLSDKDEVRKSAEVTTTGARRAPTGKVSDETILKNFAKGEIPEAGTPEAERLFMLRRKK